MADGVGKAIVFGRTAVIERPAHACRSERNITRAEKGREGDGTGWECEHRHGVAVGEKFLTHTETRKNEVELERKNNLGEPRSGNRLLYVITGLHLIPLGFHLLHSFVLFRVAFSDGSNGGSEQ